MTNDGSPVVVVTGAAGGIGAATAHLLAARGHRVVAMDVRPPVGGDGIEGFELDITDERAVSETVQSVVDRFGRIDALVNAAAVLETGRAESMSLHTWNRLFAVNVTGTFLLCRACLPHLRRRGAGSVVMLSSVHAYATVSGTAAYAATKGALVALAGQLAVEYADDGIRVNTVVVGSVDTPMSAAHGAQLARDGITVTGPVGRLGRMAQPDEIARAIAFLVSDEASFVTGAAFQVDGGLLNRLM